MMEYCSKIRVSYILAYKSSFGVFQEQWYNFICIVLILRKRINFLHKSEYYENIILMTLLEMLEKYFSNRNF